MYTLKTERDPLARACDHQAMGVVLTGMGNDGTEGLEALHRAGELTVAQDEQSCIVHGMPRDGIASNTVDRVIPLDQISVTLNRLAQGQNKGGVR